MADKHNVIVALDEKMLEEIDAMKKELGIKTRSAFVRKAINYFLAANKLTEGDQVILGNEIERVLNRSVRKSTAEIQAQYNVILQLLNILWHRTNFDDAVTDGELKRMIVDGAKEIENGKITMTTLLNAATLERKTREDLGLMGIINANTSSIDYTKPKVETPRSSVNQSHPSRQSSSTSPQRKQTSVPVSSKPVTQQTQSARTEQTSATMQTKPSSPTPINVEGLTNRPSAPSNATQSKPHDDPSSPAELEDNPYLYDDDDNDYADFLGDDVEF